MWRKQGVLECFESKLTAGCTTHRAHCQAPNRRLHSPLGKPAPQTLQDHKIGCLLRIYLGNKTTEHNSIERRHITAINTRTQDLGNELERLALHAQSSLPQCSREFRNVITPPRKISNVITRQDGCHKLMFLRKGDQYFVTLNDRPWQ